LLELDIQLKLEQKSGTSLVKLVLSRENPRHRQCADQTSVRPSYIFPYQHIQLAGTRLQQNIDVRSALKKRVLTFGYVTQPRRWMESKPYLIAMQSTMWKGSYSSLLLVVKIVSFLISLKNRNSTS
jgi:hypothetical protein